MSGGQDDGTEETPADPPNILQEDGLGNPTPTRPNYQADLMIAHNKATTAQYTFEKITSFSPGGDPVPSLEHRNVGKINLKNT